MKYCPYCGAEVIGSQVAFCAECGKALKQSNGSQKHLGKRQVRKKKRVGSKDKIRKERGYGKEQRKVPKETKRKAEQMTDKPESALQEPIQKKVGGYDGYYDDIIPADEGHFSEGIDQNLVKNIVVLVSVVLLIVLLCVMGMYLL